MSKLNTPETLATITMLAIRWPLAFWVLETRRPLVGSQVASPAIGSNEASGTSGRSTAVERLGAVEVL